MFFHFLYPLRDLYPFFNLFRYISVRTLSAFVTAFVLCLILYPPFIEKLKKGHLGQIVREDGPRTHLSKAGTPTMGGLVILLVLTVTCLFWCRLDFFPMWFLLSVLIFFGVVGLIDDLAKIRRQNSKGLSAKQKLLLQAVFAMAILGVAFFLGKIDTNLSLPFVKKTAIPLGWGYLILGTLILVGSSNAVNLTDGLDGLAIGPVLTASMTFAFLAYLSGNAKFAGYLLIPYTPGTGELTIICAAIAGGGLAFLWFNAYPGDIFLGDVGALSLGAGLGAMAMLTQNEILYLLLGGIFVAEALSVIIQVGFYKVTRKRVFLMAPLHHHFELKGWDQSKVVVRFWIISVVLALFSLLTLKVR